VPRIVDGDNLLGAWPGRSRSDADKRELVRQIDRLARTDRQRIVLLFDGVAPPGVSYGADVHFSGAGRSADAAILERLKRETDPRGWTVVTDDRSLADQARWIGARAEATRVFRARLLRERVSEKPETPGDLDYWMDVFGGKD
jgi:predicted RNA-binding protein with PIN domain